MTGSREVITGGDFKRMVSGAYSEFLLEYENINALSGAGTLAGLSAVSSTEITDGTIVNADISDTAAINYSKMNNALKNVKGVFDITRVTH